MQKLFILILVVFIATAFTTSTDPRTANFPKKVEFVSSLPAKENFWIFIMAGQSNMAGRGLVEPEDTIPSTKVYSITKDNQWILAKEPLHFYEPNLTGLDCGLSFGKTLASAVEDRIYIGIIPTAIGGSAVEQWVGDSTYRNVKLFTNFTEKAQLAMKVGTIKGIIWHQGETNAHEKPFVNYESNLKQLISKFRKTVGNERLPVIAGELGSFLREKEFNHYNDSVNYVLKKMASSDKYFHVIATHDLTHKGDSLHFDSRSQRIMGNRMAEKYLQLQ